MRIPEHKVNATLGYQITSKYYAGISYQYNSEREDTYYNSTTFMSENITLSSYGLLDFIASAQVTKHIKLFAALNNVTNKEYEELYRFQTRGRNYRLGFTLDF